MCNVAEEKFSGGTKERMSRSNEVWERWGAEKENLWIGHSEAIRRKHYKGELSLEAYTEAAEING